MFAKNIFFIDLGSSCIKGIVINEKKFSIIAKHQEPCTGVINGHINNTSLFQEALQRLIKNLEKTTKGHISKTILLVGSAIVKHKMITSSEINIAGIIDAKKMEMIDYTIQKWLENRNALFISSTPIEYNIDGIASENPFGLYVDKLQFTYFLSYADANQLGNLVYVLEKFGLDIIDVIPSIDCAAALHLSDDEKILGTLIFDIGAHTINWAYYYRNKPLSAGLIDFNSETITHKIAKSLKISIKEARELKHKHAAAELHASHFCTWAEFTRDGNHEFILESEIVRKILPEVEILISNVHKITSKFGNKAHLAVLCGNAAWLNKLADALQKNTSINFKLSPSAQPAYDALNGAIIKYQTELRKKEKNIFQKAAYWLKENL